MAGPPSENTLTVNATHHMLSDLESYFQTLSVLSPSRKMENILGYDVNLPLLKSVVFQYKRPYTVQNDSKRRFSINQDQWRTLISLYDRGQAFFTFPEVVDHSNLDRTLRRTIFIDVYAFRRNTSLAYIPKNACKSNKLGNLKAKAKNGNKYSINSKMVYTWADLVDKITQCEIGLKIREEGGTTDEFQAFESRINSLIEGDIDLIIERIQQTASENIDGSGPNNHNFEDLREYLKQLHEQDTDLSTYRIGRSRNTMLGQ